MPVKPHLEAQPLLTPFKLTVRHASASRRTAASVWVRASRGDAAGFGEGCPRSYVTGETRESCVEWLLSYLAVVEEECRTLEQLSEWVSGHEDLLDRNPSVWCAVECALLDLFARERRCSVEEILGQPHPAAEYRYTAILDNSPEWRSTFHMDHYFVRGFSDFKVKVCGDLPTDREKLQKLIRIASDHGAENVRIRLDPNNLWAERPSEVVPYVRALGVPIFAIEEPVAARDAEWMSRISTELDMSVILDESLCRCEDLDAFEELPGRFIGNIKVSKVGGPSRALRIVERLRRLGWGVVVGGHVGETSVLTRAAMLVARAAGDSLVAQEGAYGTLLVERDAAEPSLMFGRGGLLDLRQPYFEVTAQGLKVTPTSRWNEGWGLDCRLTRPDLPTRSSVVTQRMSDDYEVHCRRWGPDRGKNAVVILHGGMSHSEWQTPLAESVRERGEASVLAFDRRGCGLNAHPGDLSSVDRLIDDVVEHLTDVKRSFERVHLAGWCQGAQYAAIAADRLHGEGILSSLLLLTPGFFWNERFRSAIDAAEKMLSHLLEEFDVSPGRETAFLPIPMEPIDFTLEPRWLDYIEADAHKTTKVTMKSALIMDEVQELSWSSVSKVELPILAILATGDRIVDNRKVREFLGPTMSRSSRNRWHTLDSGHAIQFEKPDELAAVLLEFIAAPDRGPGGSR